MFPTFGKSTDFAAADPEYNDASPVYLEFCRFVKQERNLRRWDERHTEYSELTEETLMRRAFVYQRA
jgi:hypothetical protein